MENKYRLKLNHSGVYDLVLPSDNDEEEYQKITNEIDSILEKICDETGLYSNTNEILKNENFKSLTNKYGKRLLNYIFDKYLFLNESSWVHYMIIEKLTEYSVIQDSSRGRSNLMREDWKNWYLKSNLYKINNIYFNLI